MNSTYPLVSIIILNYNGKRHLRSLLESLEETEYPKDRLEIILGDNASTDDSVAYTRTSFPFAKVLQFKENYGFCKGNNLCANEAHGQFIVFLNNDTIVTRDWLKNLIDPLINQPNVVTAGCKLLKPYKVKGKNVIDYAGGKITYEINFYEGQYEYDSDKYSVKKDTGFGCGAAVIVDAKFFRAIGGFDEYYFGGGEEVEVGLRAWQYGYKVVYVPSSIVYHLRYGTFKSSDTFPTYAWVKSMFYFILKNYETKNIIFYCSESILLTHLPKLIVFIMRDDLSSFKSVIEGIFDFLFELKKKHTLARIYQERLEIKQHKKISDSQLAHYSVAASFYERMQYRVKSYLCWKSGHY